MRIVHGRTAAPSEQRATVTGEVWFDPVLPATDGTTITTVFFAPGARTYWHRHEHGQILQVLAGRGLVCTSGEQPRVIVAGDTVWVPPGERHWHGAAPDSFMTHTAISLGATHWLEEVTAPVGRDARTALHGPDARTAPHGPDARTASGEGAS